MTEAELITKVDLQATEINDLKNDVQRLLSETKKAVDPIASNVDEVTDPSYTVLLDTRDELVKQLVNPKMLIIRGKNGSTTINQTAESLNAVNAEIKNWQHRRTRSKMG